LLLPYLEESNLAKRIDFTQSYKLAAPVNVGGGEIPLSAARVAPYLCPSETTDAPRTQGGKLAHYPLNYAANLGEWFIYDPSTKTGGNGAFYPDSRLTSGSFYDGMSHTIGFAEVKAWNPYFRNAALENPETPSLESVCLLGGQFKSNTGHTEWVDGRAHQIGFTTVFTPNTNVSCDLGDGAYDVDWTNQQEGKSETVRTYAAVTSRSYHVGGVQAMMMDGSVHFVSNVVDRDVWRAFSTRAGREVPQPIR
jgi:hypothetical protein